MTVSEYFRREVEERFGGAVVMAGSDRDKPHIDKLVGALEKYGIPREVRIASAHKNPELVLRIIGEYDPLKGPLAYVAVAGGIYTDALSGMISFHSTRPVITCPPDNLNMSGLTNPPGSSNAYIARPDNAARFIAQMFSWHNPSYCSVLVGSTTDKVVDLVEADKRFQEEYAGGR